MKKAEFVKLTQQAGDHLIRLMMESQEKVETAVASIEEEAADHEDKPVLKIGFSIALDLYTRKAEFTLAFGLRHKLTSEAEITDPDQGELAIEGAGGKPKRKKGNKWSENN